MICFCLTCLDWSDESSPTKSLAEVFTESDFRILYYHGMEQGCQHLFRSVCTNHLWSHIMFPRIKLFKNLPWCLQQSSGTFKKGRGGVGKTKEKKRKKKTRIAGRDSTTALNFPSKIGFCYMTTPHPSKIVHLFLSLFIVKTSLKSHL